MTSRRSFLSALLALPFVGRIIGREKAPSDWRPVTITGSRYFEVKEFYKREPVTNVLRGWKSIDGGPWTPIDLDARAALIARVQREEA